MFRLMLDRARQLARRSGRALARLLDPGDAAGAAQSPPVAPPTPEETPPAHDPALAALSTRVDRIAESFELWRLHFETEQHSWHRLVADEARAREARVLGDLARAAARLANEPLDTRPSLRSPRVPSELRQRPNAPRPVAESGPAPPPGPTVSGNLEDVSLATVLGAFELERRDGVFRLTALEGTVELDLRGGAIVRARSDGSDGEIVAVLARAFAFGTARFEFLRVPVTADSDAPLSLNGLLLEVFHRHDEARRAV